MALKLHTYDYNKRESDLVIFVPHTLGRERHSNREYLGGLSLLCGGLVVGAQTPGTGRTYVGPGTRRAFKSSEGFQSLAADYAHEVNEYLKGLGRPRRLLVAQAGRVALGARMQLSPSRPFTHVLLRDGTNLNAPETLEQGRARLVNQPPAQHHAYPESPEHPPLKASQPKPLLHRVQDKIARLHGAVEVLTQGELLCSTESMDAVEALARDTTTPLAHITFSDGITGPAQRQQGFRYQLIAARIRAATVSRGFAPAPIGATIRPGARADLLNPLILSNHAEWALNLDTIPCFPPDAQEWVPEFDLVQHAMQQSARGAR